MTVQEQHTVWKPESGSMAQADDNAKRFLHAGAQVRFMAGRNQALAARVRVIFRRMPRGGGCQVAE